MPTGIIGSMIGPFTLGEGLMSQQILRGYESVDGQALLLTIEGLPYAWTDNPHLAGTDYCGDGRTIKIGLFPPTYEHAINIVEGEFEQSRLSISILDDETEYMARLFASSDTDAELLLRSIHPAEDLADRTELHGRHIGTECIGPAGERAMYPFVPGSRIGKEHIGQDRNAFGAGAEHTSIPTIMRGRRAALFRVYRDHTAFPDDESLGWGPWEESDRLWFGEMQDQGGASRRTWQFEFLGVSAFTQGSLGGMSSNGTGYPVTTSIELRNEPGQDETRIAIRLESRRSSDGSTWMFGHTGTAEEDFWHHQIVGDTRMDVESALEAALADARTATGTHGVFVSTDEQYVTFQNNKLQIKIQDLEIDSGQRRRAAEAWITMHEKAWFALGFSPSEQTTDSREDADNLGEYLVDFFPAGRKVPRNNFPTEPVDQFGNHYDEPTPGDGYITAHISTRSKADLAAGKFEDTGQISNMGAPRFFAPMYEGGISAIPKTVPFKLRIGYVDLVLHPGQLDRPPAHEPGDESSGITIGGGEANTQGIWMLTGPRIMKSGGEVETETQFVVASWRSTSGDGLVGSSEVMVTRILDPRDFGVDRKPLYENEKDVFGWSIRQSAPPDLMVRAFPVFRLGYSGHDHEDRWDVVFRRILLTTGANVGWTGYEDTTTASIGETDNEPSDSGRVLMDAEIRDLGLAVPRDLVAPAHEWSEVYSRVDTHASRKWKLIIPPGMQAEELFRGLLKSFGLCFSLRGGRIGIIDPIETITPQNADIIITTARSSGDPSDDITNQTMRVHSPIDTATIRFGYSPVSKDFKKESTFRAIDPGSRYRTNGDEWEAAAHGIQNTEGYQRRFDALARFYARRHFLLSSYPLMRQHGINVWPGTRVIITDPQAVGQDGHYGIVAYTGIVLRKREDTSSDGDGIVVDILVQDTVSRDFQLLSPMAIARGIDTDNNRILCHDNWAKLSTPGWFDVAQFMEPSWSTLGGNADIAAWWVHSRSSTPDWTGTVQSVNAEEGNSYIQLTGPVSGRYLRDRTYVVIMRDYANQGAVWVRTLIATVGDETGRFGDNIRSSRWP